MEYKCTLQDCQRAFETKQQLETHIARRHASKPSTPPDSAKPNSKELPVECLSTLPTSATSNDINKASPPTAELQQIPATPKEQFSAKSTPFKQISELELLADCCAESLKEVEQLVLRNRGIQAIESAFTFDVALLCKIRFLSLSHNNISNLRGFKMFTGIEELNISFNMVEDVAPLANLKFLQRLYASNNSITDIATITDLPIKILGVFNNKISSQYSLLGSVEALSSLKKIDVEGNPVMNIIAMREKIILAGHPHLKELNGQKIMKVDLEIAKQIVGEIESRPKTSTVRIRAIPSKAPLIEPPIVNNEMEQLKLENQKLKEENKALKEQLDAFINAKKLRQDAAYSDSEEEKFSDQELNEIYQQNKKEMLELRKSIRSLAVTDSEDKQLRVKNGPKIKQKEYDYAEEL